MNKRLASLLSNINEAKSINGKSIYRSCTDASSFIFVSWCHEHFPQNEISLSPFIELSHVADGVNFNGLFIYSLNPESDNNIYDSNLEWWENEPQKNYLFFADDDTSWYCFEVNNGTFWVLDKPSGEKMTRFQSLEELLENALEIAS